MDQIRAQQEQKPIIGRDAELANFEVQPIRYNIHLSANSISGSLQGSYLSGWTKTRRRVIDPIIFDRRRHQRRTLAFALYIMQYNYS